MPASRRKLEELYDRCFDAIDESVKRLANTRLPVYDFMRPEFWKPGRFKFDFKAEYARAEQNRRNEREARGGQDDAVTGSNELEEAVENACRLHPLVARKSDNPQPMMVGTGEASVHFLDLLMSPGFLQALNHLTASDIGPTLLPRLQTELKPGQAVGVTKLLQSAESMFKGALLCDEAGTGKSLTALTAALIKRKQMLPRCGFVLVVCSPESVPRWWSEIRKHFKKDDRPSCIVLDSDDIWCKQLLQFEVVICSTSFLIKTFLNRQEFYHHAFLISGTPMKNSWRDLAGQSMILPGSPIQNMEKFDEIFKTAPSTSVDGTGSMPEGVVWNMFSSYFMGQIVSRPRSVPIIPDHMMQVTVPSKPQDRLMYLKITFLVLEGKKLIKDPKTVSRGLAVLKKAQQLANHPVLCNHHAIGTETGEDLTDPFAEFEMDVMEKLNFFLDSRFGPGQAVNDGPLYGPWPEDVWKQLEICQQQCVTDGKAKLGSLTVDELSQFKKYWHSQPCAFSKGHLFLRLGLDHDDVESTSDSDVFYTPELLDSESAVCNDDLKAADDSAYQDDGFKSHGEIHDDIHDGTHDDSDDDNDDDSDGDSDDDMVMDEGEDDDGEDYGDDQQGRSNNSEQGTKRSNWDWTREWEKYVYSMEEDEHMSPRVRAIASKVAELLHQHQDEKVIVVSTSVLFLDIISHAICQNFNYNSLRSPVTFRYDGSVHPNVRATATEFLSQPVNVAKKVELLDALSATDDERERKGLLFNLAHAEGSRVLLLDAHVAVPGLSLTGASRIIFCGQFWTPGLEAKVIGCVRRFPQEKPVHVYQFFDEMSDIDLLVKDMVGDKHELTQDATAFFTRLDTDVVQVPDVPTREEHALALEELSKNKAAV
ncbi:hypothetical protein B0J15DRAFT_523996 [Fusarium solani]|uniref:SNF2 N-terminal domain-containing protein n=1 Tax=Fusarium solani TaxID=169388 RepID=A0A9P9R3A0_FUSSL|nr:uncharacterized protein B0J15DRAFT_523996 [Fusarium solani]KAH7266586.1 hypothetical protein B0J15DRAFT_523996 [Fusarium solani]